MTTYLPRSAWTTVPAAGATMPPKPVGIAVHWPGTTAPIGSRSQANMAARLEGYRRFHVDGRGWSDIAYQVGIDQDGRVWDLRGIERESAANGDQAVNLTYLACLFLLGPGEKPTHALLQAFTDWRRDKALKRYPTATRIVGHRDIRPHGGTDCPGPITEALIKAGQLALSQEDDMLTADEIAHAVWAYDQGGKKAQAWGYLQAAAKNDVPAFASELKRQLAALNVTGAPTQAQLEAALTKVIGSVDE